MRAKAALKWHRNQVRRSVETFRNGSTIHVASKKHHVPKPIIFSLVRSRNPNYAYRRTALPSHEESKILELVLSIADKTIVLTEKTEELYLEKRKIVRLTVIRKQRVLQRRCFVDMTRGLLLTTDEAVGHVRACEAAYKAKKNAI